MEPIFLSVSAAKGFAEDGEAIVGVKDTDTDTWLGTLNQPYLVPENSKSADAALILLSQRLHIPVQRLKLEAFDPEAILSREPLAAYSSAEEVLKRIEEDHVIIAHWRTSTHKKEKQDAQPRHT